MPRRKPVEYQSNGRCLAYLRVSHGHQVTTGYGLMSQGDICRRKAKELNLEFREDVHHDTAKERRPGMFVDEAESAFKLNLEQRTAGKHLLESAQTGDAIIISKLDRLCRRTADFIEIAGQLTARGIRLVICSPSIDLGTANGRALARQLASMAEWESDIKSERIKEGLKAKQRHNLASAVSVLNEESIGSDWRPSPGPQNGSHEENLPGRVFFYVRCSHRDSAESGNGMLHQLDSCRAFGNELLMRNPSLTISQEMFADPAVSGTRRLATRPSGKRLDTMAQAGDHVVFYRVDRAFRSLGDFIEVVKSWNDRGITAHFVDDGLSMDDPAGRMLAQAMVSFAEMEADLASERTKEARAQQAAEGKFLGGNSPVFWKVYHGQNKKGLALDPWQIKGYRLVQFLRHHRQMTIKEAMIRCEELIAAKQGRLALPLSGVSKFSQISSKLPRDYERDAKGQAFPIWTRRRYETARKAWPVASEAWRKRAALARGRHEESTSPPPCVCQRPLYSVQ